MLRMIGVGTAVALAAAAGIVWNIMVAFTPDSPAITSQSFGISPIDLHLQIDTQRLPVQQFEDPV